MKYKLYAYIVLVSHTIFFILLLASLPLSLFFRWYGLVVGGLVILTLIQWRLFKGECIFTIVENRFRSMANQEIYQGSCIALGLGSKATPTTSFIIGLIASVSSCLAIVGGLVLSLSATVSEDNVSDKKNFILFHIGRLVSFAVLGGVLGALGQAIGINFTFTAILGIMASLLMLFLGLHLTGIFSKNHITLPTGVFNFFRKIEHKTFTPIIVGFGTFFLPCGFTQAMQFAALASGSFASGMLIMFAFAMGTLPMLALLSFGSASFAQGKHASLFFKSAGVVVIGFGIFSLLSGLAGLGIINPLFNI